MTAPTHIANEPKYIVGHDLRSIVLCNGDTPVEVILTGLTENQAAAFALHLNLAVQLGERKAYMDLGKDLK